MPTLSPTPTEFPETSINGQPHSSSCGKMKDLGYIAGKRLNLYGEHFEIVSDPFAEGNGVAVRVISGDNPTIRTIRLPAALLMGLPDLLPRASK